MTQPNEVLEDIQADLNNARLQKGLSLGTISDGYHTYNELYAHRIALFIALCRSYSTAITKTVWMSALQSDGTAIEGWFLLGIGTQPGRQITYHIPIAEWDNCKKFATVKNRAPEYDGHTPADVLERLSKL